MLKFFHFNRPGRLLRSWLVVAFVAGLAPGAWAAKKARPHHHSTSPQHAKSHPKAKHDLTGHQRVGKASVYANRLAGRKMADGSNMRLHGDNAASKTLPLGTTARVTNLQTGQSAKVTIQDRGPHVKDRIVDLSPSTAQKIGITKKSGLAMVRVDPIKLPRPDGGTKHRVASPRAKPKSKPVHGK